MGPQTCLGAMAGRGLSRRLCRWPPGGAARWIARGKRTPEATERIRFWSDHITGKSASDYLLSVIRHVSASGAPGAPVVPGGRSTAPRRPAGLGVEAHEVGQRIAATQEGDAGGEVGVA